LAELADQLPNRDQLNTEVSAVAVSWHLDHMLKAINNIYSILENSDSSKYESQLNF